MDRAVNLVSRLLLAQLFLVSGIGKIGGYAATQGYMAAAGVPGALLPLVIAVEVGGGLALAAGFRTRWVAWGLAAFTLAAAVLFHTNFADQMQVINFMKNLAIAGGLLVLARCGAGEPSVDQGLGR